MSEGICSAADSTASTASTDHLASSSTAVPRDADDLANPLYYELRDGWPFCKLCNKYATEGHLQSEAHKYKREMKEYEASWKGELDEDGNYFEGPPKFWGNPRYYEWKDGWRWFCRICHRWADGNHVLGKTHVSRDEWFKYYSDDLEKLLAQASEDEENEVDESRETPAAEFSNKPALDPWGEGWEPAPPPSKWYSAWSEEYKRPFYYNIETDEQSWEMPEEGLATDAKPLAAQRTAETSQRKSVENIPAPWQKEWSEEHNQHFYWNSATNESRWEPPKGDQWR